MLVKLTPEWLQNDIQQSGIQQNDTRQKDNKSVILIYADKAYKQQRL